MREHRYITNRIEGLSQYKAAKEAGYAESTAEKACRIEKRVKGSIQDALDNAGVTAEFISQKVFEKITSKNENVQIRALELAAKIHKYLSDIHIDQSKRYSKVIYEFKSKEGTQSSDSH